MNELEEFFRVRIEKAKNFTHAEVTKVESAIGVQLPDEDAAGFAKSMNAALDELYDRVFDKLSISIRSGEPDKIKKELDQCRSEVEQDALVVLLQDAKKIGADPRVLDRFSDLFGDVAKQLDQLAA